MANGFEQMVNMARNIGTGAMNVATANPLMTGLGLGAVGVGGLTALAQQMGGLDAAQRQRMSEGKSGITGGGIGYSPEDLKMLEQLQRSGMLSTVEGAKAMAPIYNETANQNLQRTMQLAQQTGQITGALARQKYMSEMGMGAQSQAGQNLRAMLASQNPYGAQAFGSNVNLTV
jgi:hypothetical protein